MTLVALTDLQVGDIIPQLDASVVKITEFKVGRTKVVRNQYVELSNGRVILTKQRIVVKRQSDGRLIAPWNRIELDYRINVERVDPK